MKIWSNPHMFPTNEVVQEHILLFPFLSLELIEKNLDFVDVRKWIKEARKYIQYTSIDDCDVIVYHAKLNQNIGEYINLAEKYNKKVIALYNDDNATPTNLPNCIDVYRTSFYRSKRKQNEYALPAWSDDFNNTKYFQPKIKTKKPTIGFCGALSNEYRQQAMDILNINENVITNFLVRKEGFWGGSVHNPTLRKQYIDNMYDSDIILCCKGVGNFSYRLYETMSLGKIPLIVNSDMIFPFEDKIDWKNISIFVNSIDEINEAVNNFWNSISDNQYIDLQIKIREIYENSISPLGFIKEISKIYENSDRN